jgi:hypothetical protein
MASEPSCEIKPLWHAMLLMWLTDEALSQASVIRSALTSPDDEDVCFQFAVNDLQEQVTLAGTASASDHPPNVVIAVTGPLQSSLTKAIAALSHKLENLAPDSQCRVVGTKQFQILGGDGPTAVFYALRRLPSLDRAGFQDYWLNHHANIGRKLIPPYSYYQCHTDAGFTCQLQKESGYSAWDGDGIVWVHFPDRDACDRQLARQDVAEIAIADELKFIDHSRSPFAILSKANL